MRYLTGFLVVALAGTTVFYWVAKFVVRSETATTNAAWALVVIGLLTMGSLLLRGMGKGKQK